MAEGREGGDDTQDIADYLHAWTIVCVCVCVVSSHCILLQIMLMIYLHLKRPVAGSVALTTCEFSVRLQFIRTDSGIVQQLAVLIPLQDSLNTSPKRQYHVFGCLCCQVSFTH